MDLLNKLKSSEVTKEILYFNELEKSLLEEERHNQQFNDFTYKAINPQFITEGEEWRLISGYSSVYYVSNLGRVFKRSYVYQSRKCTSPKQIIPKYKRNGLEVTLTDPQSKDKHTYLLSTLVGRAFVYNARTHTNFTHVNANVLDCRACNLKI